MASPEEILKLAQGFMESRIMLSAAELNIFTYLKEPLSAQELATKINADARALSYLLDAAAAIGLLDKTEGKYKCSGAPYQFLSDESPSSARPMALHMASLWRRWSHLTDIVKGIPAARDGFEFTRSGDEMRAFIGAMHSIGAPMAEAIAAAVSPGSARALLDIGSGSGTYSIAFLRAVPEMKATLFDMPQVIDMARERLSQEGLLDRASLASGDYNSDEFPGGHDLALLSAIIHSNSLEENTELYKKIFRALVQGGRILIRDHVMNADRIHPRNGAIFAVNMLVGTSGGGCFTFEEIKDGLVRAGFEKVRLLRNGENMDAVVEAFKK